MQACAGATPKSAKAYKAHEAKREFDTLSVVGAGSHPPYARYHHHRDVETRLKQVTGREAGIGAGHTVYFVGRGPQTGRRACRLPQ